jgi:hypothetical protein
MKNELEIDSLGNKRYYKNDEYHREDGPAVEHTDGFKAYWLNGILHRIDGPTLCYPLNSNVFLKPISIYFIATRYDWFWNRWSSL